MNRLIPVIPAFVFKVAFTKESIEVSDNCALLFTKMKQQKGQIQLGESIFVVIIIILMIVFGLVFYSGASKTSIDDESSGFDDLESISITQYVTSLTELQCSLQEVEFPNCFDASKLDSFERLLLATGGDTAKEFYFSQLGNAKLEITQVFPFIPSIDDPLEPKSWLIYHNEPVVSEDLAKGITTRTTESRINLPVSIYDPIRDTYDFGIITITRYG